MHSMLGIAPARGKCYKNIACILLRKTRRKILCSCKGSRILLRKTKEDLYASFNEPIGLLRR